MKILIVGAGPTGLTAAVELYRRGFAPRLIDRKDAPSPLSRAIGINGRSLSLLEASGVTPELLKQGIKTTRLAIHQGDETLGRLSFEHVKHRYNFLLALPQDQTEKVLRERLEAYGGKVEYGTSLKYLTQDKGKAQVTILQGGREIHETYDLVIGADGIRSQVRESLGIPFEGFDYPNRWSIADFDSKNWPTPRGAVDMFILDNGSLRIVIRIGENRFRSVADEIDAMKNIPVSFKAEAIHNADDFVISVRQAKTYQKGCVYIAGDAAHVHSPAGGRGMNLGIEDACDLARRIAENDLPGYTAARIPPGHATIKLSERLMFFATTRGPIMRFARRAALKTIQSLPPLQSMLLKSIANIE